MQTIYEISEKLKAKTYQEEPDAWWQFNKKDLIAILGESSLDCNNFILSILLKSFEDNKKISILNLAQNGNLSTLEMLTKAYYDEDFYLEDKDTSKNYYSNEDTELRSFEIKTFLNSKKGQSFINFLTDKQLKLIDNIYSFKHLYEELKQIPDLDLLIVFGLDNPYLSFEDSSINAFAEDFKRLATNLNLSIIITPRVKLVTHLRLKNNFKANDSLVPNLENHADIIMSLVKKDKSEKRLTRETLKSPYFFSKQLHFKPKSFFGYTILEECDLYPDKDEISLEEISKNKLLEYYGESYFGDNEDAENKEITEKALNKLEKFLKSNNDFKVDFNQIKEWSVKLRDDVDKISRKKVIDEYYEKINDKRLLEVFFLFLEDTREELGLLDDDTVIVEELEEIYKEYNVLSNPAYYESWS